MTKTIDLSNLPARNAVARPVRTHHAKRTASQVKGRRNTGGGFKHHGHEASKVICNRNLWKAGAGIIWNEV